MKSRKSPVKQEVLLEMTLRRGGKIKSRRKQSIELPDRVCATYGNRSVQLKIRVDEGTCDAPVFVIEGSKRAMTFMGLLCLAAAEMKGDPAFWLDPKGAGQFHFHKTSTHGLLLIRSDMKAKKRKQKDAK